LDHSRIAMRMNVVLRRFALCLSGCVLPGFGNAMPAQATTPATHWTLPAISTPLFESHGAFDYARNDSYFVRSSREFRGWRIMVSHCGKRGWETPVDASFAGDGSRPIPSSRRMANTCISFRRVRPTGSTTMT